MFASSSAAACLLYSESHMAMIRPARPTNPISESSARQSPLARRRVFTIQPKAICLVSTRLDVRYAWYEGGASSALPDFAAYCSPGPRFLSFGIRLLLLLVAFSCELSCGRWYDIQLNTPYHNHSQPMNSFFCLCGTYRRTYEAFPRHNATTNLKSELAAGASRSGLA